MDRKQQFVIQQYEGRIVDFGRQIDHYIEHLKCPYLTLEQKKNVTELIDRLVNEKSEYQRLLDNQLKEVSNNE